MLLPTKTKAEYITSGNAFWKQRRYFISQHLFKKTNKCNRIIVTTPWLMVKVMLHKAEPSDVFQVGKVSVVSAYETVFVPLQYINRDLFNRSRRGKKLILNIPKQTHLHLGNWIWPKYTQSTTDFSHSNCLAIANVTTLVTRQRCEPTTSSSKLHILHSLFHSYIVLHCQNLFQQNFSVRLSESFLSQNRLHNWHFLASHKLFCHTIRDKNKECIQNWLRRIIREVCSLYRIT